MNCRKVWCCTSHENRFLHFVDIRTILAKALVGHLLVYNHLYRATVYSALQSEWIGSELDELQVLYQRRIIAPLDST